MLELTTPKQTQLLDNGEYKKVWYVDVKRNGETVFRILETNKEELELKNDV